jgi:hypothetical protein
MKTLRKEIMEPIDREIAKEQARIEWRTTRLELVVTSITTHTH